jgi:hypothetical protein
MSADHDPVSDTNSYPSDPIGRGGLEKSVSDTEFAGSGFEWGGGSACASENSISASSVPGTEGYRVENDASGAEG